MSAPWSNGLPDALMVGGEERPIRTDYRVALDIFLALTDPELDNYNRLMETLEILYIDDIPPDLYEDAIKQAFWYLRGGEEERNQSGPQLVSWEQDFNLIASPISKVVGQDIRGMDHLHWWTFLAAYQEIGDCLFAHVVSIRRKKKRGQKLDKSDQQFYRENRQIIDLKIEMTNEEQDILNEWMS